MRDPIDITTPVTVDGLIEALAEAAGVTQMDAHMLRESGQDATAWEIVYDELARVADLIRQRTKGLRAPLRYDIGSYNPEPRPSGDKNGSAAAPAPNP